MKEKTRTRKRITDPEIGDAYTYLGIERHSKLLLAHHVGRRAARDADRFAAKLAAPVKVDGETRPQVSTDGLEHYTSGPSRITSAGLSTSPSSSRPTRERDWIQSAGTARRK